MRASPIGSAFESEEIVLLEARSCAEVSRDHPEGIKGSQATALAVFMAKHGESKATIRHEIRQSFRYNLHPRIEEIRPNYQFGVSCQGCVPEVILAFYGSIYPLRTCTPSIGNHSSNV